MACVGRAFTPAAAAPPLATSRFDGCAVFDSLVALQMLRTSRTSAEANELSSRPVLHLRVGRRLEAEQFILFEYVVGLLLQRPDLRLTVPDLCAEPLIL
jgi:hypothetical protein